MIRRRLRRRYTAHHGHEHLHQITECQSLLPGRGWAGCSWKKERQSGAGMVFYIKYLRRNWHYRGRLPRQVCVGSICPDLELRKSRHLAVENRNREQNVHLGLCRRVAPAPRHYGYSTGCGRVHD